MLSLLIPTRGRPADLRALVASIAETTAPGEVELIVRIDDDDLASRATLEALGQTRVLVGPRGRGYADLPKFFNAMAAIATGDLLMCGNDDMRFATVDWPRRMAAAAAAYPDGVVNLGVTRPTSQVFPFSCVPRPVLARLGFLNDERLLWSDCFLHEVFAAIGRLRRVPDVVVRHLRPGVAGVQRRPDRTRIEAALIEQATITPAYWQRQAECVTEAIARLGLPRLFVREVQYA